MNIKKLIPAIALVMLFGMACANTPPCDKNSDFNNDGVTSVGDFSQFLRHFNARETQADLNCDENFDEKDVNIFQSRF